MESTGYKFQNCQSTVAQKLEKLALTKVQRLTPVSTHDLRFMTPN